MIPRISRRDLVPADVAIQPLERDAHVDGNVAPVEIDVISSLVAFHRPKTLFEIGTFDGRTTLNMAAHAPADARVFTLDLPRSQLSETAFQLDLGENLYVDKSASGTRFRGSDFGGKITQLYGDSATFDFSPYHGKVDFMFVDGSHAYDYAFADTKTALQLVREGGVILWHDYVRGGPIAWPGVTRAMKEFYLTDARFRNMRWIADTSIIMLQVPAAQAVVPFEVEIVGDSREPGDLSASLQIQLDQPTVTAGQPFAIKVRATNTGRRVWLPEGTPIGPVRLGTRLLDPAGTWLDVDFHRNPLPDRHAIFPGEVVEFEGHVPSPQRGKYLLDFDLVADGVAWFSWAGTPGVRHAVEVV